MKMKMKIVERNKNLILLLIGNAILIFLLSMLSRSFLTYGNISSVMSRMSVYAMLGIAETIVFICGGFDLTIGAVMAFSGAVAGMLYEAGLPFGLIIVISLLSGIGVGIVNAFFIVKLRLSDFIVTLSTMTILQSVVYAMLKGNVLTNLPTGFLDIGYMKIFKIPLLFIIMLITAVLAALMLNKTVLGRKIYSVGGNERTAYISGINVGRVKYSVYALSGFISAAAGLMFAIRIRAVIPEAGLNAPLEVVTAVLIGGTTIYGGKGSIVGSVLGVLTMYLLLNGFSLLGLNPFWEVIIFGTILIVIVGQEKIVSGLRTMLPQGKLRRQG